MHRKNRKNGGHVPPFVDLAFAQALEGHHADAHVGRNNPRHAHKARQLCRQVEHALSLALAGETGDDLLRDLYVASVHPAPDAAHLAVHVVIPPHTSVADVLSRLDRAAPRLRTLVAHAITRKRAPELSFIPTLAEARYE